MTSHILVSPLKSETNTTTDPLRKTRIIPRALFQEATDDQTEQSSLSDKYGYNLEKPGLFCNITQFIETRRTVEAIDALIGSDDTEGIEIVKATLKIQNHQKKIAELGMILFYLDRDHKVPNAESFVYQRAIEINEEVQRYISQHKEAQVSPLIPSGKTHYILRAISHMVMTSDQKFNVGGVLAIKQMLHDPEMILSKYIQPEHRQHILSIADNLLKDPALQQVIERKATVHKELENLIRLDLKLHPEQEVKSAHIVYDVLMALFSDVRQKDDPNCYAIAALVYTTENYTFKFFETTLQWLSNGHVTISEHYTLPLKPLVDKRLIYFHDLSCRLEYESALAVAPIEHIKSTLSLDDEAALKVDSPKTVKGSLSRLLQENKATDLIPYAEQLYVAYKCNTLNMLHLAVIEMTYMNESSIDRDGFHKVSSNKRAFINICLDAITRARRIRSNYSPAFLRELRKRLTGILWFENCNEQKIDVISRTVISQTGVVRAFEGNARALAKVFQDSLRIFSFDGESFQLINRVTDLQRILTKAVGETASAVEQVSKGCFRGTKESMEIAIATHNFRVQITNYCSTQIKRRGIRGVHLNRADLFLLRQVGGQPHVSLKLVYDIDVTKVLISDNKTPYTLMANLIEKIPTFDQAIFSTTPKVMLFTPGHHIWTLNPYSWSILLANQKGFYDFIQQTVFFPVKRKLRSSIPQTVMQRVIDTYTKSPVRRRKLENEFIGKKMSYETFLDNFLSSVNVSSGDWAKEVSNQCFSEIHLTRPALSRTLRTLEITISSRQYHQLFDSLPKEGIQPYILARKLRQKLIEQKISIKHHYDIERALCQVDGQPVSFIIGDSNWLQKNTEDPYHIEFCIGYDWVKNTLVIRTRYKDHEIIEDRRSYTDVQVQFPPVLLKSDREEVSIIKI